MRALLGKRVIQLLFKLLDVLTNNKDLSQERRRREKKKKKPSPKAEVLENRNPGELHSKGSDLHNRGSAFYFSVSVPLFAPPLFSIPSVFCLYNLISLPFYQFLNISKNSPPIDSWTRKFCKGISLFYGDFIVIFFVFEQKTEMGIANEDAIKQFETLMGGVDEQLKESFENLHQGYRTETLVRFLKAREWNVGKAHKMLVDCLNWRVQNEIDNILAKPIVPVDLYRGIRDSQLVGLSGFSKEGLPVIAVGVGLSTFDKASVHYYVQSHIQMNEYRDRVILPRASKKYSRPIVTCLKVLDMTGLKLSALSQLKLLTAISTIDDLNYPEKTEIYYIVNAPYIFSACWKVVKPLLQERTRRKIQVLQGCGTDELLKVMDYASLPHFCKKQGSGSSRQSRNGTATTDNCFSLDHAFHQELYNFTKELAASKAPAKQGSFHVSLPEPDPQDTKIVQTIESEFHRLEENPIPLSGSVEGLSI
ncbi:hypothetical protein Dimus_019242 [Dionaea muscipula]